VSARRRRLTIVTDCPARRPRSALVIGPTSIIPPALRRIGCPWQWDHQARAYLVPRQRLADVEALLTLDGYNVEPRPAALL
jgi:hypothetical protein